MGEYNAPNYIEQGGARNVIGGSLDVVSGGDLDIETGGALKIAGTAVTSSGAELNILDGVTANAAEINLVDGSVAGTAVASKCAALGANKNLDEFHTAALYLGAGAGTQVTSTAAELNTLALKVASATFVIGAEAANVINAGIQLVNAAGGDMAARAAIPFYLADDATGDTPTASAPDGGIAIGTDGAMFEWTANAAGLLISESDGDIDINLTHAAGAATWYLVLVMPNGALAVSGAITFA